MTEREQLFKSMIDAKKLFRLPVMQLEISSDRVSYGTLELKVRIGGEDKAAFEFRSEHGGKPKEIAYATIYLPVNALLSDFERVFDISVENLKHRLREELKKQQEAE